MVWIDEGLRVQIAGIFGSEIIRCEADLQNPRRARTIPGIRGCDLDRVRAESSGKARRLAKITYPSKCRCQPFENLRIVRIGDAPSDYDVRGLFSHTRGSILRCKTIPRLEVARVLRRRGALGWGFTGTVHLGAHSSLAQTGEREEPGSGLQDKAPEFTPR